MNTETLILNNLINNESYGRKVIPFLKSEYFHNPAEEKIFELIESYVGKYSAFPSKEALTIDLNNNNSLSETLYDSCVSIIKDIPNQSDHLSQEEWLLDTTEQFCQDKAIFNAIQDSILIMEDKSSGVSRGAIPQKLTEALAVSFDTSIGHDFLEDSDERYKFYHKREERIPFDLDYLNKITKGGIPRKSLSVLLAGTGVGKTLAMCHMAASQLLLGKNVLYITMEMAEEKIAERIEANLLDIPIDQLVDLPKSTYDKKVSDLKEKIVGKLIIKEYPTSTAGSNNFRHLLNELKIKKKFIPDIIYIDYLNICMSSRIRTNANVNSYTYIKAIAEELRGLAVEFNVPIITATQTTRCVSGDTIVNTKEGDKKISEIYEGDELLSNNGYNTVLKIFKEKKKVYKITLECGKEILCSKEHIFPTNDGDMSIEAGLDIGMYLKVKKQ